MAAETICHPEPGGGTSVAVVFHSASGHVRKLAHRVAAAAAACPDVTAELHDIEVIDQQLWDALAPADAIVFGCPTYMGGPSSVFKAFAEASLPIWASRGWSDKVAAGFTHSQAMSGDKLNTLQYFSLLAAQHGMLWTNVDLLPGWCMEGSSTDDLNRLGGWLGVMSQSNGGSDLQSNPRESDLLTAEHLGSRVAGVARTLRSGRAWLDHHESRVASAGARNSTERGVAT
jgi:NAD(P)H dehydrogenase (quinone)